MRVLNRRRVSIALKRPTTNYGKDEARIKYGNCHGTLVGIVKNDGDCTARLNH